MPNTKIAKSNTLHHSMKREGRLQLSVVDWIFQISTQSFLLVKEAPDVLTKHTHRVCGIFTP